MDLMTVRQIFARIAEADLLGDELSVAWHAGEPLVLPPTYYEAAFEEIRMALPAGLPVQHTFQTNGTLLNEDWCLFLPEPGPGLASASTVRLF